MFLFNKSAVKKVLYKQKKRIKTKKKKPESKYNNKERQRITKNQKGDREKNSTIHF